jgi:hypothetical protein
VSAHISAAPDPTADYAPGEERRPGDAEGQPPDREGQGHELPPLAPRTTRLLSAMWAAQAVADGVQLAYSAGKQQT